MKGTRQLKTFAIVWMLFMLSVPWMLQAQNDPATSFRSDYIIVKYAHTPSTVDARQQLLQKTNATLIEMSERENQDIWRLPESLEWKGQKVTVHNLIDNLNQSPEIEYAEPNYTYGALYAPNDPQLIHQWGLSNTGQNGGIVGFDVNISAVWDNQTGGSVVAGIIDTGIDYMHEDLAENIWQNLAEDADGDGKTIEWNGSAWELDSGDLDGIDADGNGYVDDLVGWDFVNNDNNPFDDNGHGTHIAGVIGAKGDNGIGIAGMNWDIEMMALKAFDANGVGSLTTILPALAYARDKGVDLTNNSWGGGAYSQALYDEIALADADGQLFVAAAGNSSNDNSASPAYPSSFDLANVISVGACDASGNLASFSNYGLTNVDIIAPGLDIYSTLPNASYGSLSGTSMSTAFVTGGLALLMSEFPALNSGEVTDLMMAGARRTGALMSVSIAGGIIDLGAAIASNSVMCPAWMNVATGNTVGLVANDGSHLWAMEGASFVRLNKTQCAYSTPTATFVGAASASGTVVSAMAIANDGKQWVGTNAGLQLFDGSNWTGYDAGNSAMPSNAVNAVVADANGGIWVGTDLGLAHIDGTTWTIYQTGNSTLLHNQVNALSVDHQGDLWVGTEGGLMEYDGSQWTSYTKTNSGLTDNRVQAIATELNGNVWVGTMAGLVMFDPANCQVYTSANSSLSTDAIHALAVDQAGNKWIGCWDVSTNAPSTSGLVQFDDVTWTVHTASNSVLPNSQVHSIDIDDSDNVWVGTQDGIGVLFANASASFSVGTYDICQGATVNFDNTSTGSNTFEWFVDGVSVGTTTDLDYTFTTSGAHNVSLLAGNGSTQHTYVKSIYIHPTPTVDLGADFTSCADAHVLNAGIEGLQYQWTDASGTVLGTDMKYTATSSDTYTVAVSNVCGSSASDDVVVTLTSGCVWAGDVNADGEVNMLDYIWIGQAHGTTGTARSNASTAYSDQASADWNGTFNSPNDLGMMVDHKHADADGNGTIDITADGAVVLQNLNSVHSAPVITGSGGIIANLQGQLGNVINNGESQIVKYTLFLEGENESDLDKVYSISFTLAYEFESSGVTLELNSTWFNGVETAMEHDAEAQEIHVGITATDGLNREGSGAVVDIDIIATIEDIQSAGNLLGYGTLTASVSNLVVLDESGNYLPFSSLLTSNVATVKVPIDSAPDANADEAGSAVAAPEGLTGLSLFPNPCSDRTHLAFFAENPGTGTLSVRGLDGRLISQEPVSFLTGGNQVDIQTNMYPSGLYIVTLEAENRRYVKKMHVIRDLTD